MPSKPIAPVSSFSKPISSTASSYDTDGANTSMPTGYAGTAPHLGLGDGQCGGWRSILQTTASLSIVASAECQPSGTENRKPQRAVTGAESTAFMGAPLRTVSAAERA